MLGSTHAQIGVVGLALVAASCGAPPPMDQLHITYSADRSCQPTGVDLIRISALGDFPATPQTVTQFSPADAPSRLDGFPADTLILAANTQTELFRFGGARQLVSTGTTGDLLLLPVGQPCALTDDRVVAHDGAAAVALPDGGALLIGGTIAGGVQSQVLRLDPDATTATLLATEDGLAAPRTAAAATLVTPPGGSPLVVVAGGQDAALLLVGPIEIYDVATGRFDATRCPGLAMLQPRTRAGAGALPDGRVLVAGGVDAMDHAFGTAELVDPVRCAAPTRVVMPGFVVAPWVGALDDGTVVVAGGEVDVGGTRSPNTNLWVFSAEDRAFSPFADGLAFRPLDSATVVPLPGARLAYVGFGHGTNALQIDVLYTTGTPYVTSVDVGDTPPLLSRVTAAALPDGRLLVAGADMSLAAVAYVADLGAEDTASTAIVRSLIAVPAKVRATELRPLADGVVLELAPEGAALRRTSTLTTFDNPTQLVGPRRVGALIADLGLEDVALDDASHWQITTVPCRAPGPTTTCYALVAQPTPPADLTRLDAPTLRFGDARITVDVTGDASLLLSAPGLSTKAIAITDDAVSVGGCNVARTSGATVTVDRIGESLVLTAGGPPKTCAATFGAERFSLGFSARSGTALAELLIERVADN